jgi:ubiquitin C-terminal hydrolase
LKPNANACDNNNITDNDSILCHQQSNAAGSERLPLITDVDFGLSDKDSIATTISTPSSSFRYVGLRNMSKTCYINVLLQWLLHLVPFRNCLLESPLGVDNETFFENMNNSGSSS